MCTQIWIKNGCSLNDLFVRRLRMRTANCRIAAFGLSKPHLWNRWYDLFSKVSLLCWKVSFEHFIYVSRCSLDAKSLEWSSAIPDPVCPYLILMLRNCRNCARRLNSRSWATICFKPLAVSRSVFRNHESIHLKVMF